MTLFLEYSEVHLQMYTFRCTQKDTSHKYFFKFKENVSPKVRHHLKGF